MELDKFDAFIRKMGRNPVLKDGFTLKKLVGALMRPQVSLAG